MSKRMLIDASHPEETRVVVLDGQKVEEFDFEAASKRPLKGNIYLAKVTRVEPSLQAAFVEYGGNRQGFLAFSEIHPDYYQIPLEDRQALLAEQEAEARRQAEREDAEDDAAAEAAASKHEPIAEGDPAIEPVADTEDGAEGAAPPVEAVAESNDAPAEAAEAMETDGEHGEDDDYFPPPDKIEDDHSNSTDDDDEDDHHHHHAEASVDAAEEIREGIVDEQAAAEAAFTSSESDEPDNESDSVHEGLGEDVDGESSGGVDAAEEIREGIVDEQAAATTGFDAPQSGEPENGEQRKPAQALQNQRKAQQRFMRRKHYKIQDVIKRRQIILVQVVKEERGNKGAALTTYLSLAGRYCVLMPNTPRGGGISRKITSASDRKRLKSAAQALDLPEGMGLIIRTAGENRTKLEIKRDYEYLLRMWDTIRETTLASNAPACVYEEGDLIKRAIRDLYNKDVTEIIVEGDAGYKNAKDFMRMLMPSHAKNVKPYKETVPLFQRHHIEAQLDAMFQPTVTLKSGGYIVINQTEALVSIDVNSGRATREHSIEETAHKTNLEAADEVGRQLRLRDLAGLIVIDFIDMEDHRNDRSVEKRLHNAVKNDRARIQIGKISQFGLMEMSRQRLRAGVIAGSTVPCPHCNGQGIVRSVESTALRVLRGIEDEAQKLKASAIRVKVPSDVALYTLNQKRKELARIEDDYGMSVSFEPTESVHAGDFEIERLQARDPDDKPKILTQMETTFVPQEVEEEEPFVEEEDEEEIEEVSETAVAEETDHEPRSEQRGNDDDNRRGGRRRRRGGRGRNRRDRDERDGHRPQAQQQQQRNGHAQNGEANETMPVEGIEGAPEIQGDAEGASYQPSDGENGEGGNRRRRRRRGRRGRRDRDDRAPQPYQGEGVPVDASVREDSEPGTEPNAASSPVWSLTTQAETPVVEQRIEAPAPEPAQPNEPAQAPRKGWWQRVISPK